MADVPQTFAEIAKHSQSSMVRAVVNTLIADDELLGMLPLVPWPGGESHEWVLNKTAPTWATGDETTTMYSTKPVRYKCQTNLAQYWGETEMPVMVNSTLNDLGNPEMEDVADLIRGGAQYLRGKIITGAHMTEGNVTLTPAKPSTPAIDAVTAVSANMPRGSGWVAYVHASTSLKFRAPGSNSYGALVSIAGGDADYTLKDGDDTTKFVTVTIDASDLTGGAENMEWSALQFQRPEDMAGLREQATLDSTQVPTIATDGAALTLAQLDELDEMVLGPRSDKVFLMNARTRRAAKTLIAAAGGSTPTNLQRELAPNAIVYNGIPLIAVPGISITETQGASGAICGRVYCVRLNPSVGLSLMWAKQSGPNMGTLTPTSDDDVNETIEIPMYVRRLMERENTATFKWRASMAVALKLARSKSCAVRYGVTT